MAGSSWVQLMHHGPSTTGVKEKAADNNKKAAAYRVDTYRVGKATPSHQNSLLDSVDSRSFLGDLLHLEWDNSRCLRARDDSSIGHTDAGIDRPKCEFLFPCLCPRTSPPVMCIAAAWHPLFSPCFWAVSLIRCRNRFSFTSML